MPSRQAPSGEAFHCVVSAGTRFHSYRTAEGLHRRGALARLVTGRQVRPQPSVPARLIRHIPLPEYVGLAAGRFPRWGSRIPYNAVTDNLFDLLASRRLERADVFLGFGKYSLMQMQRYKERGALLVLDQRSAHVDTELGMWRHEASKFGIPYPPPHLNPWIAAKARREYALADLILTPSEYVYASMRSSGVAENKLRLVPFGVDTRRFQGTGRSGEGRSEGRGRRQRPVPILLFVGALSAGKGLHYLLDALLQVTRAGQRVELRTVGLIQAHMRPFLDRFARQSPGTWQHCGTLSHTALAEMYRQADIFCLPTLSEGSALVLGEAAACGLPILTTTASGSTYRANSECIMVPPADSAALAQAILRMTADQALRENLAEAALARTATLTWQEYGAAVYGAIAAEFRPAARN